MSRYDNPAEDGMMAGRAENRAIAHGVLDTKQSNLDQAIYVATVLAGGDSDKTAVVYGSTHPDVADPETGEAYLIFRADDVARLHLRADQGWAVEYTIISGR